MRRNTLSYVFVWGWSLSFCLTFAQAKNEYTVERLCEHNLTNIEREMLRITTEWSVIVQYSKASENAVPEALVQRFVREQEHVLREMAQANNRDEAWVQRELDRLAHDLRKSLALSECRMNRTVIGDRTFWLVYGDLCTGSTEKVFGKKEAIIPGSVVIESRTHHFSDTSARVNWSTELASIPLTTVVSEYNTTLLANSLLLRVFVLGESPLRWIDKSKAKFLRDGTNILIEAAPLRRPLLQGEAQNPSSSSSLQIENVHQLRDRWWLDTSRGYRVARYESAFGDIVVEVLGWRKYQDLWIPETVKLATYKGRLQVVYNRQTGKYKALLSEKPSVKDNQPISVSLWRLARIKFTSQPTRLEDHLRSDRILQDLRLGNRKVVGYSYSGTIPTVDALEEMYKQQQEIIAERERMHSSGGLSVYTYILPVLLILTGVYWLYRRKRLQRFGNEP